MDALKLTTVNFGVLQRQMGLESIFLKSGATVTQMHVKVI